MLCIHRWPGSSPPATPYKFDIDADYIFKFDPDSNIEAFGNELKSKQFRKCFQDDLKAILKLTDNIRKEIHFFGNIRHFLEEKLRFANDFAKPAFEKQ